MKEWLNQDIIHLYCLMGEALCLIQHLEDALSHSITLKNDVRVPSTIPKEETKKALEKYRSYTLGKAVNLAKKAALYSDILQKELENFLSERNWLVHKCIDDIYMPMPSGKNKLFRRIKSISTMAATLQKEVEVDLIEFSESRGMDMSKVRAVMEQYRTRIFETT